jgi:hypothetical protein
VPYETSEYGITVTLGQMSYHFKKKPLTYHGAHVIHTDPTTGAGVGFHFKVSKAIQMLDSDLTDAQGENNENK